ncbi:MAG: GDSL-type esterase/lipase family protein [candidate division KSB1 bacterium]|nr:GDSL-type esterase/lipase family protein [candidate division KSB1 bacterium]MDZ7365129.1 GDSL-type esterase/lipase family protein [candidate division KSB1 bacterium]MDZ7404339.1 GDSL-type esterase/lipase family protein [candidate division KSB1 bacterium]
MNKTSAQAKATKANQRDTINSARARVFYLIALSLPVLFFLFLEIGLRLFDYGGNLDLFMDASGDYAPYRVCNPNMGARYFFMQSTIPDPPNDAFLKIKPANGYRIFVMGESTTAGYPYGNNVMFSRFLHKRLADTFPDKHIEVVNVATSAVNSYTVLDRLDEVLAEKPDAILIYLGHNEFYGALGVASNESLGKIRGMVKLYLKLERFKTFLLLRDGIGKLRNWISRTFWGGSVSDPSGTLMERMVAEQTVPYGSALYELGKRQFEGNLRDILQKAKQANVPVILSEVVSNVRDQKPFIGVATDSLPSAETVYQHAQKLEADAQFDSARALYYRAKDFDALRFRASEEFNQIIHRVAAEFDAPVVPMKKYFEAASPNGLIGNNLMLEHLHPNLEGYFLMSDAYFDVMRQHGFVAAKWDSTRIKPSAYYRATWGFTALDKAYADLRIRILKGNWPFQPKNVPNRALMNYQPATKAESLAVEVWTKPEQMDLERAHVALANFYEKQGRYDLAYDEFNALICMTPFNPSPYLRAANALIQLQQYDRALPILLAALKLEDAPFANKWIGQIYLNNGRMKEAFPYLEKALQQTPEDPQLLYNLSGGYALDAQYEKSQKLLEQLFKIDPDFPEAAFLKRQVDSVLVQQRVQK